jgi:cytochrome b561
MPLAGFGLALTYNLVQLELGFVAALLKWLAPLHRWIGFALAGLIALHIGAAFFHQLIRKDNLLSRMWYESKQENTNED